MRKSTVILAVLALVGASCTKIQIAESSDSSPSKGAISLSAYTAMPTKAAQVDVTTDNFEKFEVTAIGNSAVYFDNVSFSKNSTSGVWESDTKYFWPAFALDFYAYNTPAKGTFSHSISPASQTLSFTPSTTLAEQEDLVAACVTGKKETDNNAKGAIALSFNHYLTQVIVMAKNSNSTYKVEVDGAKLANLVGEGTYAFASEGAGTMAPKDGVKNTTNAVDYSTTFTTAKTLSTEAQEVMTQDGAGRWYLVPQPSEFTAWAQATDSKNTNNGTYLALKVKITANNGALKIYPATGTESAWMAIPIDNSKIAFAQGKRYNITVDFFSSTGNGAGYVDPETPGELDGDNQTEDNGKKIIGGAIKFDANVVDWQTVDVVISL